MCLYALVLNDIGMSPGKVSSQSGHAYLGAFLASSKAESPATATYASQSPGTKICLQGSIQDIIHAQADLSTLCIPHYLVVDSGCKNFFNAAPTVTALGFGPCLKSQLPKSITRLRLY